MEKGIMGLDPEHKERHEELYQKLKHNFDSWFTLMQKDGIESLQKSIDAYIESVEVMFELEGKNILYDPLMDEDIQPLEEIKNILDKFNSDMREVRSNIIHNYYFAEQSFIEKVKHSHTQYFLLQIFRNIREIMYSIHEVSCKSFLLELLIKRIKTGYKWKPVNKEK